MKKTAAIIAYVLCVTAVVTVVIVNTIIIPNSKYNNALALMNEGDYAGAIYIFEELGNFNNSEDMIAESKYLQALYSIENNDYQKAVNIFNEIKDYKDSSQQLYNAKYELAKYSLSIDFEKTAEILIELRDCDSAETQVNLLSEEIYLLAKKYFDGGYSTDAYIMFASLEEYKDSKKYAEVAFLQKNIDTSDTSLKNNQNNYFTNKDNSKSLTGAEIEDLLSGEWIRRDYTSYVEAFKSNNVLKHDSPYYFKSQNTSNYVYTIKNGVLHRGPYASVAELISESGYGYEIRKINDDILVSFSIYNGNFDCIYIRKASDYGKRHLKAIDNGYVDANNSSNGNSTDSSEKTQSSGTGSAKCSSCNGSGKQLIKWYSHGDWGEVSYTTSKCSACGGKGYN